MPNLRLTKDDCDDIGFARACLTAGIISFDEFKQWLYLVVEQEDSVPNYIWDLIDLKEEFDFKPLKIMGFNPYWVHTDVEDDALEGIGYKRRQDFVSDAVSRPTALRILEENRHIAERFQQMFPFTEV